MTMPDPRLPQGMSSGAAAPRDRRRLADAREFLDILQQITALVRTGAQARSPDAQRLGELSRGVSAAVKEAAHHLAAGGTFQPEQKAEAGPNLPREVKF